MSENERLVKAWGNNVSNFPDVQKGFDQKIVLLLDTFFKNASEYQKEKFIKASFDQIRYLESLLLHQQGVHFSQLKNVKTPTQLKSIGEELKSIEQSMIVALNRMFRHASIYLPAVNLKAGKEGSGD